MYVVLTLLGVIPVLIVIQVGRLGLIDAASLRDAGIRQAESVMVIPALRGMILDRENRVLATNEASYELAVDPTVAGFSERADEFSQNMMEVTGRRAAHFGRIFQTASSPRYVFVDRGLTEEQKARIQSWHVPGVVFTPTFTRRLNHKTLAAHLIGHTDRDGRGIAGIEGSFDSVLSGIDGQRIVQRDRTGHIKAIVDGPVVEPRHGEHVVLTIDLVKQAIMEEELAIGVKDAGAAWGTAIAIDPRTGAIIGMANSPTYDPARPGRYDVSSRRNHAITDHLEPGSTFKIVTAVAAVDKGIVTMHDSVDTENGRAIINGRVMRDTHKHGQITFSEVLVQSSNIGTAKIALKIEPGVFYQYARNLGFGQPTGIALPGEVGGTLKKPQDWSGITLPWMSQGYEVEATALQILGAYAALANGGVLMRPYIVSERRDRDGNTTWSRGPEAIRRAFKTATADSLIPAFERVVTDGTGRAAAVSGLRIAGKTGTAQKTINGTYARGKYRASFVGFFPADDPQVAIVVILDEPSKSGYGGVVAAPIFGRIARRWVSADPSLAMPNTPHDIVDSGPRIEVPEITSRPLAVAVSQLVASGLKVDGYNAGADPFALVALQEPLVGTKVPRETEVELSVNATPLLSDAARGQLKGLSCRHAVNWLIAGNNAVRVRGTGRVHRVAQDGHRTVVYCR